ncbi:TPA: type 1 fimbrial protein [Escherichia coli]|nr:type 1 fimbrial protein [Escherichia coli]HAW0912518.1 type 1 fimbrial protein [Escherichia coli]
MNKKLLSLLVSGSFIAAVSTSVFAADTGVVNFNGKIVADTCEINVNDSNSTTGIVTFADTYSADYSGDGTVGTSKDFKIELIKCDPLVTKLNLTFSGTTTDTGFLRLENSETATGSATNVGITVTNKNGGTNNVKFDGSVPDVSTDVDNAGDSTPTIFNYTANVIQVGNNAPTAGKYASSATFEVFYR